jgi:hypothetical protein
MTTTAAPAPRPFTPARVVDVLDRLIPGTVVRVASGGPELRITAAPARLGASENLTVVLAILTGAFAGATITRLWHPTHSVDILRAPVFMELVPAYYGPGLPTCPDGSGDLWWDDASYIRYQSFEPICDPAYIADGFDAGFCDGKRNPAWYDAPSCSCHAAAPLTDDELADCPF